MKMYDGNWKDTDWNILQGKVWSLVSVGIHIHLHLKNVEK